MVPLRTGKLHQKSDELTTPDPARDGTNWVVYCAANPVGRWDPSGCIQYPILPSTTMQQIENPSSTLRGSEFLINDKGCAVAAIANMLSKSLEEVNKNYVKDGNLKWQKVADDYGWELDRADGSQFTKVIYDKQNNNSKADFYTIENVNYTPDNQEGDHWVGVQSVITKNNIDYVVIAPSSINDSSITTGTFADRKGRGWLLDKLGNILVPVTETKGYRTFYKGDVENEPSEVEGSLPKGVLEKDPKTKSFLASIFNWGDEE